MVLTDEALIHWLESNKLSKATHNAIVEWGILNLQDLLKLDDQDIADIAENLSGMERSELRKAFAKTLCKNTPTTRAYSTANLPFYRNDHDMPPPSNSCITLNTFSTFNALQMNRFSVHLANNAARVSYGSRKDAIVLQKVRTSYQNCSFIKYNVQTSSGPPSTYNYCRSPVLLLLGKTGAGKSTFINYLVNFVLGVKVDDPFRFVLVNDDSSQSQTRSVTKNVTVYDIPACDPSLLPCGLVLIDTPGFADTQGRENDQKIAEEIKELLKSGCVPYLHKIVFVASATECRLTPETVHVIDSVTTIFASDIRDHIEVVLTKVDNPDLKYDDALKSLSEAGLPVQNTTRLNQSVLYRADSDFVKLMWNDVNAPSLTQFVDRLTEVDVPNYLHQTLELIEMRELLVSKVDYAKNRLRILVSEAINYDRAQQELSRTHPVKTVARVERIKNSFPPESRHKALNCEKCQGTCHKWCKGGLARCHNFRAFSGGCRVCACPRSHHKHDDFFIELKMVTKKVADEEALESLKMELQNFGSRFMQNRELIAQVLDDIATLKREISALSMFKTQVYKPSVVNELEPIKSELLNSVHDQESKQHYKTTLRGLKKWLLVKHKNQLQEASSQNQNADTASLPRPSTSFA